MDIKKVIKTVPDFPVEGVQYKDVTSILENPQAFQFTVDQITDFCQENQITDIVAPDARGFLWGAPVSLELEIPLHIVRKPGKLPGPLHTHSFEYEYAETSLNIKKDANLNYNSQVCIIDDVSATGGTGLAIAELLTHFDLISLKYACVIDLTFLGGTDKLRSRGIETFSVVEYE